MFEVREETSPERFMAAWEECMKEAPWFDSDAMFWVKPEEELERLRCIHGDNNLFLVAGHGSDSELLGALSVQVQGGVGKIGPWDSFKEHARNSGTEESKSWSSPSDTPATPQPRPPG
jgi:hypothetical protein